MGTTKIRSRLIRAGAGRLHHSRILLSKQHQPADVPSAAREGRGPVEMRIGLNLIRITAEAERDWQRRMQEPKRGLSSSRARASGL